MIIGASWSRPKGGTIQYPQAFTEGRFAAILTELYFQGTCRESQFSRVMWLRLLGLDSGAGTRDHLRYLWRSRLAYTTRFGDGRQYWLLSEEGRRFARQALEQLGFRPEHLDDIEAAHRLISRATARTLLRLIEFSVYADEAGPTMEDVQHIHGAEKPAACQAWIQRLTDQEILESRDGHYVVTEYGRQTLMMRRYG